MGKFKEFTQEQRKEICRLYIEERKGLQNIGNLFNSAQSTIKRILTEEGITLRSHRESKKKYEGILLQNFCPSGSTVFNGCDQ